VFELHDIAIATSGDYRHWVDVGARRLSHTMDPARGAPLLDGPASVTVLAPSCMQADALASAFMVLGEAAGHALAARLGVEALFLTDTDRSAGPA
jgi:thiamine biosynthesis lipoprotein